MFNFIKKAINAGKPVAIVPKNGWSGWNRDVDASDPEFNGCCLQPFIEELAYGQACLNVNSIKAIEWAEYVYGGEFILPKFWGNGTTPNPAPCKKYNEKKELVVIPGRYHYLFVRKGSRHDKTTKEREENVTTE